MLDTMRANSRSILTYVLFGIIIVVFVVSFGPGSKGCGPGAHTESWAAKVNDEAVSPGEFEQQYAQLARLYRSQGGGDVDALLRARLRQMTMDQLVQRELVEQEARRAGIVVGDDDVSGAVHAISAFQTNGRFDIEAYKRIVTANYGSLAKFEEQMRRDLAYQKMLTLVRDTAKVSEDEVKAAWLADNDRLDLELARFPFAAAKVEVKVTDAQLKDFEAKNAARIEQFYKDTPARFDRKKRVRARHILAKADDTGAMDAQDAARKRVEDAGARIAKGEDFAKVAAEVSDDPGSKDRGGELGWFGPGLMAKPFEEQAFKMKAGEISPPVKTQFGWHLIQVEEVQEPEVVPLEKARTEIARELLTEDLAKDLARRGAEAALGRAKSAKSLADVLPAEAPKAGKRGPQPVKLGGEIVKAQDTGTFAAAASPNVPLLGPAPELFADALAAGAGQVLPRVYQVAGAAVVARVKERTRPDEKQFAEKKGDVETRLRLRRESEIERAWVDALRKKAKIQLNEAFVRGDVRAPSVELD